jgi:hypothetical protein
VDATGKCPANTVLKRKWCPQPGSPSVPPTPTPSVTPSFTVNDATVNENAGTVTITITKSSMNSQSSTINYATVDGTAKAGTNYTATSGSLTFLDSDMSKTVTVPVLDDGVYSATNLTFSFTISPVTNALVARNGTVSEVNMDAAPPPPAPTPAPTTASGASDTISGNAPIASEFDYNLGLQKSWDGTGGGGIPASAAPDVVGAFRFICGAGQLAYDDPVVYPNQPGASHLHQFYGNITTDNASTFSSQRQAGDTTCGHSPGASNQYPVNRSGYWMPAVLDGKGHVVLPDYVAVYYKRRPLSDPIVSDPTNAHFEGYAVPIPNGLRFIFGYDMLTNTAPTGTAYFNCAGPTAVQGHYKDIPTAAPHCPAGQGNQFFLEVDAPTCWDGVNLDSPNHRSHVGYPSYGYWGYLKCPADHPYVIPAFHLAAAYTIAAGDDVSLWSLSSDAMHPELTHGSTLHADYFEGWDNNVKLMWTQGCIDHMLNCSGGDLGNGKQIIGTSKAPSDYYNGQWYSGWTNPNHLVPIPVHP